MTTEMLRALLLEYLKSAGNQNNLQFRSCISGVSNLAEQRCADQLEQVQGARFRLREADGTRLKHVIWDLILERVLIPGTKSPSTIGDGWPFLSLTEHGLKVVTEGNPVPYDPDGYLDRLAQGSGPLHSTVKKYLEESLSTFRTGNYLSAAVMLGAASEMLFVELCIAIGKAIANPADRNRFENQTAPRKNMVERVNAVKNWLNQKKTQLPTDWQRQELIGLVEKVADLIRSRRNDAGHPQERPPAFAHEEIYALLNVFPHYYLKLHELDAWLRERPASIS